MAIAEIVHLAGGLPVIMTLLDLTCHCCPKAFTLPDRRLRQSRTGIFHCSRECTDRCPALHQQTLSFTCEQCHGTYNPRENAARGELRSQRWCSQTCKRQFKLDNGRLYRDRKDAGTTRATWVEVPCHGCKKLVSRRESEVREFVYCSRDCYRAKGGNDAPGRGQPRRKSTMRVQTKNYGEVHARVNKEGYVDLYIVDHPLARRNGTVAAHRVVMEEAIGRHLERDELVHHRDGNRQNNAITNLELCRYFQPPGQLIRDQVKAARAVLAMYGDLYPEGHEDEITLFDVLTPS